MAGVVREDSAKDGFYRAASGGLGGGADWEVPKAVDSELLARQRSVAPGALRALRAELAPAEDAQVDDQTASMYVRATGGDIAQAAARLKDTLAWRQTLDPRPTCSACAQDSSAHYMHPIGFDRRSRPVLYSCFALAKDRTLELNRQHMVATFEETIKLMPRGVEQWVWFSDFHGFGLRDMDPRFARTFLELSSRYYPERLGVFLVVGAPSLFSTLWHMIQPLVDPKTRRKLVFAPYDVKSTKSQLRGVLQDLFDEETAAWLLAEMAQNRARRTAAKKDYPYGAVLAPPRGLEGVVVEGHDLRGTPSFLAALRKPQA